MCHVSCVMLQAGEVSPLRVRVHVLAHHHGHRRGQAPSHLQAHLLPGGSVRRRPPRGDTLTADRVRLGHADLCGHPPDLHHILSAPHHQDQDSQFQHNHGTIILILLLMCIYLINLSWKAQEGVFI